MIENGQNFSLSFQMWQTCTQEINSRTSCRARSRKMHPGIETPYPSPSFFFYQVIKLLAHQTSSNILQKHYHPPKTNMEPKNFGAICRCFLLFPTGDAIFFQGSNMSVSDLIIISTQGTGPSTQLEQQL